MFVLYYESRGFIQETTGRKTLRRERKDEKRSKRKIRVARRKGLTFYQKKKRLDSRIIKDIFEMIVGGVAAVFLAFVIVYSVGMRTSVIGDSMETTLFNGQEILVNRVLYRLSTPKRGDVIVFLPNGNQNSHFYVKRVVGLPGETVQIKDGSVYIDGVFLEESEEFDRMIDAGIAENEMTLEIGRASCRERVLCSV